MFGFSFDHCHNFQMHRITFQIRFKPGCQLATSHLSLSLLGDQTAQSSVLHTDMDIRGEGLAECLPRSTLPS
jgi:hypothetical protein